MRAKRQKTDKPLNDKPYHHGDLRQALIDALREVIEEQGPTEFSLSEACRRAGVSSAAPYRHFKDRPDIIRAVALDAQGRLAASFREACAHHPFGSFDAIYAIGRAYVAFAEAGPSVFRIMFGMDDPTAPERQKAGNTVFEILLEQIAEYYRTAIDAPEVLQTGLSLWSYVHGVAFLRIDGLLGDEPTSTDTLIAYAGERILGAPAGKSGS